MAPEPFNLDHDQAQELEKTQGTPLYVYSRDYLNSQAKSLYNLCSENRILLRYAVKANPHEQILKIFKEVGLHFDASSEYEAQRLLSSGISADKICLNSQQPPKDMSKILASGLNFVATSFHQLELAKQSGHKGNIGIRVNPGLGAGHNNRTKTGGIASSFGIWHEYLPNLLDWQKTSNLTIDRMHMHIGSGGDPKIWEDLIDKSLELVKHMPDVNILNIGGGFKIARMEGAPQADLLSLLPMFAKKASEFKQSTGREIKLEIEPGTWLVANSGALLAAATDIVDTGPQGYSFIKVNTGMNDFLRSAMYGAQHPIKVLNDSHEQKEYVVVGHNCETGDILTPAPSDPEEVATRTLAVTSIGDLVSIGGVGAYGASMRAIGYNDFPAAKEFFV